MRLCIFVVLFALNYAECKKSQVPIDKNANVAFINMEGGGYRPPPNNVKTTAPTPAPANPPTQTTGKPLEQPQPMEPHTPVAPAKPPTPIPIQVPVPQAPKSPTQVTPKPVYPAPVANPITTPGPGSVKQLITFYDSQGKASPIRPYTYSQAVKQG